MLRRWAAVPLYGALLAPVWLLLRDLSATVLAALGVGVGLGLLARRRRRA